MFGVNRGRTYNRLDGKRVQCMQVRPRSRREFLIQLNSEEKRQLGVREGDAVAVVHKADYTGEPCRTGTTGEAGKRSLSVIAFTNFVSEKDVERLRDDVGFKNARTDADHVRLDQTLRAAIVAPAEKDNDDRALDQQAAQGSHVSVFRLRTASLRQRLLRRWNFVLDRAIATQPELFRTDYARWDDMEIPVARIAEDSMSVIGVSEGDFVRVESVDEQGVARFMRLRAVKLTAEMKADRKAARLDDQMKGYTFPTDVFPELGRISGASSHPGTDGDLSSVYLDFDARTKLHVDIHDPVRVVRDTGHLLTSRLFLIVSPALVSLSIMVGNLFVRDDPNLAEARIWLVIVVLTLVVLLISAGLVVLQLRRMLD